MFEILTNQRASDDAFRRWVDAIILRSTHNDYGWVIEGKGVAFSKYGYGDPGKIENQIMLGSDPEFKIGIVKIVRPNTSKAGRGKQTVIGRRKDGHLSLLREGCLQKNPLSRRIQKDFASLSGLKNVPLFVGGKKSVRDWYVVADLFGAPEDIVAQTAQFTLACARARSRAGGGSQGLVEEEPFEFGADERGGIIQIRLRGGTTEVCKLQGYVSEALRSAIGQNALKKPKKGGFEVDGVIIAANLLIEIKTGAFARNIYEAVGQLVLYPSLIGLPSTISPVLLIPDRPTIKAGMAGALDKAGVEVYTYSIVAGGRRPKIIFSEKFLERCRFSVFSS